MIMMDAHGRSDIIIWHNAPYLACDNQPINIIQSTTLISLSAICNNNAVSNILYKCHAPSFSLIKPIAGSIGTGPAWYIT